MKRAFPTLLLLGLLITNCNESPLSNIAQKSDEYLFKETIYHWCDSIIHNKEQFEKVWNFQETIPGSLKKYEVDVFGQFENEEVYSVEGFTGCSAGCTGTLLLIFDTKTQKPIHISQQPLDISFIDIYKDGKSELLTYNFIQWMGRCSEYHKIIDIEKDSTLLYLETSSPLLCEDRISHTWSEDTVLNTYDLRFENVDNDKADELILNRKIRLKIDTLLIQLTDTLNF